MVKERNTEGIVEAVLFIAGRFLTVNDLVMYTGINPLTIKEAIKNLEEKYKNHIGALDLVVKGDLYKMDIKPEYTYLTNKLASGSTEFTKAEQETLAIIAYKQPINQSLVVRIRGNKAYEHIKKMVDVGLVKPKKVGHTYELRLDDAFYDYFGLKARERLQAEGKNLQEKALDGQGEELAIDFEEGELEAMPSGEAVSDDSQNIGQEMGEELKEEEKEQSTQ